MTFVVSIPVIVLNCHYVQLGSIVTLSSFPLYSGVVVYTEFKWDSEQFIIWMEQNMSRSETWVQRRQTLQIQHAKEIAS